MGVFVSWEGMLKVYGKWKGIMTVKERVQLIFEESWLKFKRSEGVVSDSQKREKTLTRLVKHEKRVIQ